MKLALIGYGAIAAYVAEKLHHMAGVELAYVICRAGREEHAMNLVGGNAIAVNGFDQISVPIDLVIECGGHEALKSHAKSILSKGVDLLSVSSGVMSDDRIAAELLSICEGSGAQVQFAAGAIGPMDALHAARIGGLTAVTYTGRKKPAGWKGSRAEEVLDLDSLNSPACHFTGTAREAAQLYPKNANVAATIALCGIGMDQTRVELYADPDAQQNIHEIKAQGVFGSFTFIVEGNSLPDNPRSSALTAMSVVQAVEARLNTISV